MNAKKAFGDFQTPNALASKVVAVVSALIGNPDLIVEPTAGYGNFLSASLERWGDKKTYEGYELNREYVAACQAKLDSNAVNIYEKNFFTENWEHLLSRPAMGSVLVIGNPPWVTNSALGQLGIKNLPVKSNSERLRGMDARTGKSNFDIAEWMIMRLIDALPTTGALAMLCKTATARKVLKHYWKRVSGLRAHGFF